MKCTPPKPAHPNSESSIKSESLQVKKMKIVNIQKIEKNLSTVYRIRFYIITINIIYNSHPSWFHFIQEYWVEDYIYRSIVSMWVSDAVQTQSAHSWQRDSEIPLFIYFHTRKSVAGPVQTPIRNLILSPSPSPSLPPCSPSIPLPLPLPLPLHLPPYSPSFSLFPVLSLSLSLPLPPSLLTLPLSLSTLPATSCSCGSMRGDELRQKQTSEKLQQDSLEADFTQFSLKLGRSPAANFSELRSWDAAIKERKRTPISDLLGLAVEIYHPKG